MSENRRSQFLDKAAAMDSELPRAWLIFCGAYTLGLFGLLGATIGNHNASAAIVLDSVLIAGAGCFLSCITYLLQITVTYLRGFQKKTASEIALIGYTVVTLVSFILIVNSFWNLIVRLRPVLEIAEASV